MLPIFTDGSSDFAATMRRLSSRGADDLVAVEPVIAKVVGPQNIWVLCAKRLAFGDVGIDGFARAIEIRMDRSGLSAEIVTQTADRGS